MQSRDALAGHAGDATRTSTIWLCPLAMASSSLTALPSAAVVEETLLRETERGIVLRFGRAADPLTRRADAQLRGVAQRSDELLEIFTVDLDEIAEFTATFELHDRFSILCFWRGRVLQLDTGFGLEPKITALGASSAHLADVLVGAVRSARGEAPPPAERVVGGTTWLTGLLPGLSEGLADAQSSARAGLHTITQRLGEYGLM